MTAAPDPKMATGRQPWTV